MTIMEYWDGLVTTVHLVFLSLVIGLVVAVPLAILRTVRNPLVSGPIWSTPICSGHAAADPAVYHLLWCGPDSGYSGHFWWEIFKEPLYPALLAFTLNTAAYTRRLSGGDYFHAQWRD